MNSRAIECAWEAITVEVNSVSRFKRVAADVRKKFRDMRSGVKNKKAAERREAKKQVKLTSFGFSY